MKLNNIMNRLIKQKVINKNKKLYRVKVKCTLFKITRIF